MKIDGALVVKYIADVWRMEPRNIGVIAWVNGRVVARFGERPPRFIRDKRAYNDWLYLWRHKIDQDVIESADHTIRATKDSPDFLNVLKATGRDNYVLMDGGSVLDRVDDANDLVEYLFEVLVGERPQKSEQEAPESDTLRVESTAVVRASGLERRRDVRTKFGLPFKAHNVLKQFTFDYALGDVGHPSSVYQRVLLANQRLFDADAFMLEWFERSPKAVPLGKRCAFVDPAAAYEQDKRVAAINLRILEKLATPVDVRNQDAAVQQTKEIAGINGQPREG
ncbi:MAG: hypothetical protein ABIP48_17830 [Planctomycetota bacterium]